MDSFYCVFSTITTLGYGDQSFSTTAGPSFAIFWILVISAGLSFPCIMVSNNATEPLRQVSVDPDQKISANIPHRTRFIRRVRSAPLAEFVPKDIAADGALKHSNSIFGELHSSCRKIAAFLAVCLGVGTVCFYFVRDDIKGKKTNGILELPASRQTLISYKFAQV
ncbi:hypothetical protein K2173_015344 [Erythroxylum novogranatense]|uniref:Potassium channel domain-containing protein n=1 Tax=Erythroxylum novogranatense TaxID=1862640 RepID=A0AAV8SRF2_9ROSI|nr:hypothetical protein K2173_015344 [Erythroxylum novogranatense]